MGLMSGKKALIFGVANERSIAWGITKAFHREGATIGLSYAGDAFKDRVMPLAPQVGATFVEPCDVGKDDQIDALFAKAKSQFGTIDVLVHAIAFAKKEDLEAQYVTTSRDGFRTALEVSAYSLVALAQRARGIMTNGGAILTLSYYGAEKVIPHYNVMGVAKAAPRGERALPELRPGAGQDSRQRDLGGADQDAGRRRRGRLPLDARLLREERAAAPPGLDRRRGQHRALALQRPRLGHHGRDDLRRRRLQHHGDAQPRQQVVRLR
jgi:hypothetical protein